MKFHENLKRICNAKGTNPTQVCKDLGLSTSKVAAWNKGGLPKQDTLVKLAEFLDCSVMDFFEDETATDREPAVVLDDDEMEILRIFRTLNRRSKHEFMACVYKFEKQSILQGDDEEKGGTVIGTDVG